MRYVNLVVVTTLVVALAALAMQSAAKDDEIAELRQQLVIARNLAETRRDILAEAHVLHAAMEQRSRIKEVTVTAYTARPGETDNTPEVTAAMTRVRPGTIAVSRDLFAQGWVFGKKVRIEGLGIFEINDLTNRRFEERIDIYLADLEAAQRFGIRTAKAALLEI